MIRLKVRQFGASLGVALPDEALLRLKVRLGDDLFLTETPDGFRLTPYGDGAEFQLKAARAIIQRRRAAMRALSK